MTTIAVYLFFVGALSGYRTSRYWPKGLTAVSWLRGMWWNLGCFLLAATLLLADKGWTTGLLLTLCIYMTVLSCIIFFANCNHRIRLLACILFHVICVFGLIAEF